MSNSQETGFNPHVSTYYGEYGYQQYPNTQQYSTTQSLPGYNPGYNPLLPSGFYPQSFENHPNPNSHQHVHVDTGGAVPSAPPAPEGWTGSYNANHYPLGDHHYFQTLQAGERKFVPVLSDSQGMESEFTPVPLGNHQQTESLIAKINELTRLFLPNDLRPEQNRQPVNETYDMLKRHWQNNSNLYPVSYQAQMNGAIRETDKIVRSNESHASRQKMFLLAVIALGVLTLFGTYFTDRRFIAPNTLSVAKTISKIIVGVAFFQLVFSRPLHENRAASPLAQLYLRDAMNNSYL